MSERSKEETQSKRDAILSAARTLFAEKGYEETTIPEIARTARIAVGTVYLYFRNKHEILTHVALDLESSIAQAFRDAALLDLPFEEIPRAMVEATFRIGRQKKEQMGWLHVNIESQEEITQHQQRNAQLVQSIDTLLRNAIVQGHLAPFKTEMYAQLLHSLGHSVLHQCFAVEKGAREEWYRQAMIEFIERLFFGPPLSEKDGGENMPLVE